MAVFWVTYLSRFEDEEDDLDEENIPGFSHPTIEPTPRSTTFDKGKARVPDRLATPTGETSFPRTPVSGNIGSAPNGTPKPNRTTIGGVRVETRCVVSVMDGACGLV